MAAQMAATNNDTLAVALKQLSDKFVTMFTTSEGANIGITLVKDAVQFLTKSLTVLVPIGATLGIVMGGWAAYTWIARKAMMAFDVVVGFTSVLTGKLTGALIENEMAVKGVTAAMKLMSLGWLGGIGVLAGAVVGVAALTNCFGLGYDANVKYTESLGKTKDGFEQMAKPLSDATIALNAYNDAMKEYQDLQNFQGHQRELHKKGAIAEFFGGLWDAYAHPLNTNKAAIEAHSTIPHLLAPQKSDYGADTSETNPAVEEKQSQTNGGNTSGMSDEAIKLLKQISENTKSGVGYNNNGNNSAPPVRVTSTMGMA
jgi:hypothetical protein